MIFIFKNLKFKSPTIKQSITSSININKSRNQEGDNGNYRLIIGDKKKRLATGLWTWLQRCLCVNCFFLFLLFAPINLSHSLFLSWFYFCEFCNISSTKTFLLYPRRFAWDTVDKPFRLVTTTPQEVQSSSWFFTLATTI